MNAVLMLLITATSVLVGTADVGPSTTAPNITTTDVSLSTTAPNITTTDVSLSTTMLSADERVRRDWDKLERELKKLIDSIIKHMLPMAMKATSEMELSGPCMSALLKLTLGLRSMKSWAFEMIDAMGKPNGGVLDGTITAFGSYDECVDVVAKDSSKKKPSFTGKYCLLDLKPPLPPRPKYYTVHHLIRALRNISAPGKVVYTVSRYAHYFLFLSYRIGMCLPSVCSDTDIRSVINYVTKDIPVTVNIDHCEVKHHLPVSQKQLAISIVFGAVVLLVLFATVFDMLYTTLYGVVEDQKMSLKTRMFLAFSAFRSTKRLVRCESSLGNIRALHGIRFFCLLWVVAGHVFLKANYQMLSFLLNAVDFSESVGFQMIVASPLALDTLFLTSGFLLAYDITSPSKRETCCTFIMRFFYRLLRYAPPYLVVIGIVMLLPLTGSGPMWHDNIQPLVKSCETLWWTNLLYINNLAIMPDDRCLPNSWYLSCDIQLLILGLLLAALMRWSRAGIVVTFLFIVASIAVTAVITAWRDFPPAILFAQADTNQRGFVEDFLFDKPYPHVAAFCIGLSLGYVLARKSQIVLKPYTIILGWIAALVCTSGAVFGLYQWNSVEMIGTASTVLFGAIHRTIWSLGVAWTVFVCVTNNGGVINQFLGCAPLMAMSRFFFLGYLIHPIVQDILSGHLRERLQSTTFIGFLLILAIYSTTCFVSSTIYVLVEEPLGALSRLYFERKVPEVSSAPVAPKDKQGQIVTIDRCQNDFKEDEKVLTMKQLEAGHCL